MKKRTNTETGQTLNLSWNTQSQLMGVQIKNGTTLTKEITYKYDALGRRIERVVTDYAGPTRSFGRKFLYDGHSILEEQGVNSIPTAKYLNGPGIDDPILVARAEGAFTFTKDGLNSVRDLIKSDGSPLQKYRYSTYGVTTQELQENRPDKKLVENRYAFTGREIEEETGLYYNRARYYDAETGRWISEDPILFEGGDTNLYVYVQNDPVNWIDPSGLAKCTYGITSGKLSCESNDGNSSGSANMFSGNNDPNSTGSKFVPIPIGKYDLTKTPGAKDRYWFIDPGLLSRIGYRLNANRGAFNLHLRKGGSNGCITGSRGENDNNFSNINNILNQDAGSNTIEVGF